MLRFFALIILASSAWARVRDIDFELGFRYDNINRGQEEERWQERIRLSSSLTLPYETLLKFRLATGHQYISNWSTVYDLKKGNWGDQNFNFRQFYFERKNVQLGIIPPIKELARTGLDQNGWVEGLRLTHDEGRYHFDLTAGSLNDTDNPSVTGRHRVLGYGRAFGAVVWEEKLSTGLALATLDHDRYFQWIVDYHFFPKLTLTAESLINTDEAVRSYSFGFRGKFFEDDLSLEASRLYLDKDIGTLGSLTDDFYIYGYSWFYRGEVKIIDGFFWRGDFWGNKAQRVDLALFYRHHWED